MCHSTSNDYNNKKKKLVNVIVTKMQSPHFDYLIAIQITHFIRIEKTTKIRLLISIT